MRQILNFIVRNKNFLLFLLLFCFSVGITIQSNIYHRSTFINSANWLTGGIYGTVANISDYFSLKTYNQRLLEENTRLRNKLHNIRTKYPDSIVNDSASGLNHFTLRKANVIKNSYSSTKNYLLIENGKNGGITENMGVITSKGIVGIVEHTSSNYSVVQSVLNGYSQINASLKNTDHFGSLTWNGKNFRYAQLIDLPRQAPVKKGDTIITGGMSSIFPKGILIGTVDNFSYTESGNAYIINVKLFNDMSNIGYVYIIENKNKQEIDNLEATIKNE